MQFLFLLSLPFCSALSGSHVTFTLGDSTYSHNHGDKMEFNHSTPVFAAASAASSSAYVPPAAAPVYHTPPPPVFYSPTPAPYHLAPIRYLHDPVVVSKPHYYHHHPVYAPEPVYQAPRQGKAPRHNCSVVTEMTMAEVCTPSLQTTCMMEELAVKTVTDKEQCMNIMRTVCSETTEEIENEVCVYTYQNKSEDTMATNYKVTFQKECKTQRVSVCQPSAGFGYERYGQQYCKEVEQETCYNIPMVMPMQETVTVTYPEPVMECMQKPITIPRISCEDMTEERCIMVPGIMEDTVMVEKCQVSLGSPSCQVMEVILPKQVCKELVYGQTYLPQQEMSSTVEDDISLEKP
eukprot:TRINITY_DN16744_c0_g1_i1.p1 TRINITY_DN16744_c0_g1~~TRINITY_DN16744_c0_g1_i1.p1  ORF type:complete len:349 (-),score=122.47 TRINITY_DN16744_c0_g1_i1:96-1142(-)